MGKASCLIGNNVTTRYPLRMDEQYINERKGMRRQFTRSEKKKQASVLYMYRVKMMNCTLIPILEGKTTYFIIQTCVLVLFLLFIIFMNLMTLVGTATCDIECQIRRVFMSSYIGNILGGISLLGNDIVAWKMNISSLTCMDGFDRYILLYLGVSANMIVLVMNTYVRYQRLKIMRVNSQRGFPSHKQILLQYTIPAWLGAIGISIAAFFVQKYYGYSRFLICVAISVIPLTGSIICNILLTRYLGLAQKMTENAQRSASEKGFNKAQFLVKATVTAHAIYLIIGIIVTVIDNLYKDDQYVHIITIWILRLIFTTMFTIESEVFLYKTPHVIRRLMPWNRTKKVDSSCKRPAPPPPTNATTVRDSVRDRDSVLSSMTTSTYSLSNIQKFEV